MKEPFFTILACMPLIALVSFAACSGQTETSILKKQTQYVKVEPGSTPKIIKSSGSKSADNVRCAIQVKKGDIWFGTTHDGLYRYDGKSFIHYTINDGLCSNSIGSIAEDTTGKIWIATRAGICQYNGKSFTYFPIPGTVDGELYLATGQIPSKPQITYSDLFIDKTGKLWIGTDKDGIYRYDGHAFIHFLHQDGVENPEHLQLNFVYKMLEDRKGNIWFSTWFDGVCCFNGHSVISYKPGGNKWFAGLFEDHKGNLWAGTRDSGVYCYDGRTFTKMFAGVAVFNQCSVSTIVEDKAGNIWFGTEYGSLVNRDKLGGVWYYNTTANLFSESKNLINYSLADGLSSPSVFCLLIDRSGKLWVGTRETGLYQFDGKRFLSYSD